MSQRLFDKTKWLCCLLSIHVGSFWVPVTSITVRTPPNNPATIEAQAKFFQDFFSVQLSPYKMEFGHVCEDPDTWEQRYEKKDFKNHRDMGKVRWGDKKGGYGEHYWDLNHAGHTNDHGNDGYEDDGSYHETNDPYDEPSEHSAKYDEYDPEKSSYDESGRAKRAHPKVKINKKRRVTEIEEEREEKPRTLQQKQRKEEPVPSEPEDDYDEEEEYDPPPKRHQHRRKEATRTTEPPPPPPEPKKEKNNVVLVVTQKDDAEKPKPTASYGQQPDYKQFVPYEGGAGVRQHQQPETSASVPRLFLEPSTGHVVDRATGQAYVLQPIVARNNYN